MFFGYFVCSKVSLALYKWPCKIKLFIRRNWCNTEKARRCNQNRVVCLYAEHTSSYYFDNGRIFDGMTEKTYCILIGHYIGVLLKWSWLLPGKRTMNQYTVHAREHSWVSAGLASQQEGTFPKCGKWNIRCWSANGFVVSLSWPTMPHLAYNQLHSRSLDWYVKSLQNLQREFLTWPLIG